MKWFCQLLFPKSAKPSVSYIVSTIIVSCKNFKYGNVSYVTSFSTTVNSHQSVQICMEAGISLLSVVYLCIQSDKFDCSQQWNRTVQTLSNLHCGPVFLLELLFLLTMNNSYCMFVPHLGQIHVSDFFYVGTNWAKVHVNIAVLKHEYLIRITC